MKRGTRQASTHFRTWCAHKLQRETTRFGNFNPEPSSPDTHQATGSVFDHAVGRALSAAQPDASVGMLLVSIDYFDVVTASHGANIAHELLSITADRIGDVVRLDDEMAQHDDGFFILLAPGPGAPAITEIASRITTRFNQPIMTSAGQLPITVSVGITSVSGGQCTETTARMIKRQARSAVLSAQRTGRAQLAIFDQATQKQAIESYETERQLHTALRNERLGVHYQPIVSLHSGQTIGVEALARWNDDVLGSISPATFIPIAEEAGLIGELGRQIMQMAIAQSSAWNQGGQPVPITTINLSNRQLLDPDLIPTIALLLHEHDLDPSRLCLEISESVVMSDVAASMTILGHMKDLGLRLAIDNFGTGYSSLSYLRRLPVDMLKIDQSFVQSVYNRDDRVITKAIIDLAHTLGMTTVAEGVETRLQVEVLHALNCDMAQGFYLHVPAEAAEVDFGRIDFEAPSLNENLDFSSASARTAGQYVRQ
jgi:diguanylate cyclase (GGDEF)-like protein